LLFTITTQGIKMRKLYYCGLEQLESRYTLQLQNWNERVFDKREISYVSVLGKNLDNKKQIVTGSVLDAHGRTYYSMTQMAELIKLMQQGEITNQDVIFFEDMFTPGIESLAYIMDQIEDCYKPKVFVRCLAQTFDPDDFVIREGMFKWMRKFEEMTAAFVDGIIVANEEFVAHLRIAGIECPIYVSGLPFGKEEVASRMPTNRPLKERTKRVTFAARWDDEKQPHFFMDLIEEVYQTNPEIEFCVCTGGTELKGNNEAAIVRAREMEYSNRTNFKIYQNLKKDDYYRILADTTVLFNCALQDWTSNTVSEADTLGALTLYPAYRSFPEVFANNRKHLYAPWSIDDAIEKLCAMFCDVESDNLDSYSIGKISDWQNGTIDRTLDIMLGNGEHWRRNGNDYRKHVAKHKF
jgi:hypothetical protein